MAILMDDEFVNDVRGFRNYKFLWILGDIELRKSKGLTELRNLVSGTLGKRFSRKGYHDRDGRGHWETE